jgi:hypothetical protein
MGKYDLGLLGGADAALGAAIPAAIQGYYDAEDRKMRQMEFEAKKKAQENNEKRQLLLDRVSLEESGFDSSNLQSLSDYGSPGLIARREGFVPKSQREQEQFTLDTEIKRNKEARDAAQFEAEKARGFIKPQSGMLNPMKVEREGLLLQKARDEASKKSRSPLPGYEKTEDYVGTPQEEMKIRKGAADVAKFTDLLGQLRSEVASADQIDLANPISSKSKSINRKLRDLQLIYKNPSFAELGVLTGPDLQILEQVVERPGAVSNLLAGKDSVLAGYDEIGKRIQSNFDTTAGVLGLRKVESSAQAPKNINQSVQLSDEDRQALEWANSNPKDPRASEIKKRLGR